MKILPYDATDWQGISIPKFRCPERAWKFLKKHGFRRLPADRETVFLKSASMAVDYARKIGSRLPVIFEREIIRQPSLALQYFQSVVEERVPEYEHIFKTEPKLLVEYAYSIIKGRLPEEMELWLMGDPYSCFEYSWQILDGRLPEVLHNFMFGATLDKNFEGKRYRGCRSKLDGYEEYNPSYSNPQEYFEYIKWQRKNLHRLVVHYASMYGVDTSKTINEFLEELKNGR
jgi:hypothetical protein